MSILIKGMEMPKDGVYWCEIGVAGDIATITIHGEDRKSFSLVSIPDGRLNDNIISRQTAIELAMQYCPDDDGTCSKADKDIRNLLDELEDLPSAQLEPCELCKNRGLEDGDTLYVNADWDGGVGFDYIHDIHYCPKCGRRL